MTACLLPVFRLTSTDGEEPCGSSDSSAGAVRPRPPIPGAGMPDCRCPVTAPAQTSLLARLSNRTAILQAESIDTCSKTAAMIRMSKPSGRPLSPTQSDTATCVLHHTAIEPITAAVVFLLPDFRVGCGGAPVRPTGMSAVRAASSARVRDVSAEPTRRSNSSMANRPCTNAALSKPIVCSRSACDARSWLRPPVPAAISSPGSAIPAPLPRAQSTDSVARLPGSGPAGMF